MIASAPKAQLVQFAGTIRPDERPSPSHVCADDLYFSSQPNATQLENLNLMGWLCDSSFRCLR